MKYSNALTLTLLAICCLICSGAQAYGYIEQPLERRVKDADIVVYVKILDPICCLLNGEPVNTEEMVAAKILATLKGHASEEIIVRYREGFVESDPECCRVGAKYLMFLQKTNGGHYALVNKRFGLIPLESSAPE